LIEALKNPDRYNRLRMAARQTVKKHYELQSCLDQQINLIDCIASGAIGNR